MKETKTYCDHCGKRTNPFHDYEKLRIDFNHEAIDTDLCESCFKELVAIVRKFCRERGKDDE